MIKYICDKCASAGYEKQIEGNELSAFVYTEKTRIFQGKNLLGKSGLKKIELHLCKECTEKVKKFILEEKLEEK